MKHVTDDFIEELKRKGKGGAKKPRPIEPMLNIKDIAWLYGMNPNTVSSRLRVNKAKKRQTKANFSGGKGKGRTNYYKLSEIKRIFADKEVINPLV